MKKKLSIFLTIIKIILIVFASLELLFWFAMFTSGHQIPRETSNSFLIHIGSCILLLIILMYVSKLIKRKFK